MSEKEYHPGRKPKASGLGQGARMAPCLRASAAGQVPVPQRAGRQGCAGPVGPDMVRRGCEVAVSGRDEGQPQLGALMVAARRCGIERGLARKSGRFARSTRPEASGHLGARLASVQDPVDGSSAVGRARFTIIGAVTELEGALVRARAAAAMPAAEAQGRHPAPPGTLGRTAGAIEAPATSTGFGVWQIHGRTGGRAGRSAVESGRRVRAGLPTPP